MFWQKRSPSHADASSAIQKDIHVILLYGVATISRLLQMIGLFCTRALYKRRYSAKETYNFMEPTHRSHPISIEIRMLNARTHSTHTHNTHTQHTHTHGTSKSCDMTSSYAKREFP